MVIRKYTEVKLNPKDEKLVFTVLELSGWYKSRCVDIINIEKNYKIIIV
jgi:hypothetical protein